MKTRIGLKDSVKRRMHPCTMFSSYAYDAPSIDTTAVNPVPFEAENDHRVSGFVYLVTCIDKDICKLGRWSGTLSALKSRYRTYYKNPSIMVAQTHDSHGLERTLKAAVKKAGLFCDGDCRRELVKCTSEMRQLFMDVMHAENSLAEFLAQYPGVFKIK